MNFSLLIASKTVYMSNTSYTGHLIHKMPKAVYFINRVGDHYVLPAGWAGWAGRGSGWRTWCYRSWSAVVENVQPVIDHDIT